MYTQENNTDSNPLLDSKMKPAAKASKATKKGQDTVLPSSGLGILDPGYMMDLDSNHPLIAYFESILIKKEEQQKGKSSFLVFKNGKYITIQTKEMALFYIKNDSPTLMCFDKSEYTVTYSLDEIHKLLAPTKFFRMNRKYLVNFSAIKEVEHYFSRKLIVKLVFPTAEKLLVGKDKTATFFSWTYNR
nr:LytTR family DNA-binding domain-containing protein [Flavobacterium sp. ASV13]